MSTRVVLLVVALSACSSFRVDESPDAGGGSNASAVVVPCPQGHCTPPCKALRDSDPSLASGTYVIDPDGPGPRQPQRFRCDMAKAGGGWTLVGRSVVGGEAPAFGWRSDNGGTDDDTKPFSLDVASLNLDIREILLGKRGEGKEWGEPVYRVRVPDGFIPDYSDSALDVGAAETIAGTCKPPQGPNFLRIVGFTSAGDHFAFTDQITSPSFGLEPDGWDSNQGYLQGDHLCDWSADLGGVQAMIFVR